MTEPLTKDNQDQDAVVAQPVGSHYMYAPSQP